MLGENWPVLLHNISSYQSFELAKGVEDTYGNELLFTVAGVFSLHSPMSW